MEAGDDFPPPPQRGGRNNDEKGYIINSRRGYDSRPTKDFKRRDSADYEDNRESSFDEMKVARNNDIRNGRHEEYGNFSSSYNDRGRDEYRRRNSREFGERDGNNHKNRRRERGRGESRECRPFSKYDDSSNGGGRGRDDYCGRQDEYSGGKRRRLSDDGDHRWSGSDGGGRGRHMGGDDRDKHHRPPKKPIWPSPFEDSGGSYVFDARSRLFYEAESNFFYDPKNKLYYSNERKIYYRYCPEFGESDKNDIWKEVHPEEGVINSVAAATGAVNTGMGGDGKATSLLLQALQGSNSTNLNSKAEKKKINICIKKKFTGSANLKKKYLESQAASKNSTLMEEKRSVTQKAHSANIAKWAGKAQEMKSEDEHIVDASETNKMIKRTKTGTPVCCLCKRKFADIEKLKQHEKLSKMHQQNLVKKKQLEETQKTTEYRDRANERRVMYDVDPSSATIIAPIDQTIVDMGPSLEKARTVVITDAVNPDKCLDENNVGNKMLQKLGWKSGEALGRKDVGTSATGSLKSTQMEDTLLKLRQDWDRIENLSSKK